MGKQSAPPPPDYTSAAQATTAGNLQQAQYQTAANRVNQVGPNGSLTYTQSNPGDPYSQWTATQTLSPAQQQLNDMNNQMSLQYAGLGQQGLGTASQLLANPQIDQSQLAAMPQNAGTTTQDAIMSRLSPQIQRENAQQTQQLANQGIMPGSEAYNTAETLQGQQHNDLLNQAALQGVQTDMQARNQGIANQSSIMNQPLNMINALRTGSQVVGQNYVNPPQQGAVAGPDMSGAAQGMYNAALGNTNANNANTAQTTQTGIGLATLAMMASDRKVKTNIVKLYTREDGLNVYEFDYKPEYNLSPDKQIGVMADEVEKVYPNAVIMHQDGYKMVNYAMLG